MEAGPLPSCAADLHPQAPCTCPAAVEGVTALLEEVAAAGLSTGGPPPPNSLRSHPRSPWGLRPDSGVGLPDA